jgi:hypothetical protein
MEKELLKAFSGLENRLKKLENDFILSTSEYSLK